VPSARDYLLARLAVERGLLPGEALPEAVRSGLRLDPSALDDLERRLPLLAQLLAPAAIARGLLEREDAPRLLELLTAEQAKELAAEQARRQALATTMDASEAEWVRQIGTRLRRYRVERILACGATGAVFRATRMGLGDAVALKVFDESLGPSMAERFRAEAVAIQRLSHPGIVRVLDAGEEGGLLYLAMELVEGPPLQRVLGTLERRELAAILEKVARAVHHAHERGVVHRDLKPSNILLRGKEAVVLDFGLARIVDVPGRSKAGMRIGTPYTMAPEQVEGREAGPAADVFALGVILYRGLTGRWPHDGPRVEDVFRAIRRTVPVPPRSIDAAIPRDLEAVCLAALEKEESRRTPSAAAFGDDLARVLRGEKVRSAPVPRGCLVMGR
jgi:serine/threonine protein kinase